MCRNQLIRCLQNTHDVLRKAGVRGGFQSGTNSAFKKYTQGHTWLQEDSSLNMEDKALRCEVSGTENGH